MLFHLFYFAVFLITFSSKKFLTKVTLNFFRAMKAKISPFWIHHNTSTPSQESFQYSGSQSCTVNTFLPSLAAGQILPGRLMSTVMWLDCWEAANVLPYFFSFLARGFCETPAYVCILEWHAHQVLPYLVSWTQFVHLSPGLLERQSCILTSRSLLHENCILETIFLPIVFLHLWLLEFLLHA